MNRSFFGLFLLFLVGVGLTIPPLATAQSADQPVARAVLFYSPTCPHCHEVIENTLIPLVDKYGDQLQILAIDVTQPDGQQLYLAAVEHYQIQHQGVPTLVVGEVVLIGGLDIPQQFPALVESGLTAGGIDWPAIPGLAALLPTATPAASTATPLTPTATLPIPTASPTLAAAATAVPAFTPVATASPVPQPTSTLPPAALTIGSGVLPPPLPSASPPPDPVGFALAGIVLVGMLVSLGYATWQIMRAWLRLQQLDHWPITRIGTRAIPGLALLGLGVAVYLAYVEITHVEAICGPIGACNVVQSSPYARIFGIPIAVLGVLFYLLVGVLWVGQKYLPGRWAGLVEVELLGLSVTGLLFSIYLTWLELFVIQAVCAWCLSSAVISTGLLLLIVAPVTRRSLRRQTSF
ncbi:MAG: hypothetical protein HC875_26515 [Anaerolineales bacterium]|nr:hypothetical protein [Anaerolineales bacterium]